MKEREETNFLNCSGFHEMTCAVHFYLKRKRKKRKVFFFMEINDTQHALTFGHKTGLSSSRESNNKKRKIIKFWTHKCIIVKTSSEILYFLFSWSDNFIRVYINENELIWMCFRSQYNIYKVVSKKFRWNRDQCQGKSRSNHKRTTIERSNIIIRSQRVQKLIKRQLSNK